MKIIEPSSTKDTPYVDAEIAEDLWKSLPGITKNEYPQDPSSQKQWDLPICKFLLSNLNEATDNINDQARFNAITQEHSSDWLYALPSANLGLKLDNNQFRIACALRLGG